MRRYVMPLLAANLVTFATVGISYLVYSRLLSPGQFGVYSSALAIGNLATLVLDGGIRASIIKHADALTAEQEGLFLRLMLFVSVVLLVILFAARHLVEIKYPALAGETTFVTLFAATYLLTYPWIGLSTASLERQLAYRQLAWIEGVGIILERGSPALFIIWLGQGLNGFVLGLVLGRITRIALLSIFHHINITKGSLSSFRSISALLKEGVWYQGGGAASLIRDNLHVIVIGPLCGKEWVGYYAWGLQLCLIASQVFVQISARVTLPLAAQSTSFEDRWKTVQSQVGVLTTLTVPILIAALIVVPVADAILFSGKWHEGLILLPYLFARMLPGISCTPVGTLLLVERGAYIYARGLWAWTIIEALFFFIAARFLGPVVASVAYAATAWVGLMNFIVQLRRPFFPLLIGLLRIQFGARSLWTACIAGVVFLSVQRLPGGPVNDLSFTGSLLWGVIIIVVAYASDRSLWSLVVRRIR